MNFRRLLVLKYGPPEVLQMVAGELPDPGAHMVRLRTLAAGVSFIDLMMRRGLYPGQTRPPFTPGVDMVGVIDKVGPGVQGFREGQQVCALLQYGGYSEALVAYGRDLFSIPEGLNPTEVAAIPLNYVAAAQMLHRIAKVPRKGKILIHGAAGGVGSALAQLARREGIKVYGTAASNKYPHLEHLGVIPVERRISFRNDLRAQIGSDPRNGLHAVFDSVGPMNWRQDWQLLRPGGKLIAFGEQCRFVSDRNVETSHWNDSLLLAGLRLTGGSRRFYRYDLMAWKRAHPDWYRLDLMQMLHLLKDRKTTPLIAQTFPWEQAAEAHGRMERGELVGKAVLSFEGG